MKSIPLPLLSHLGSGCTTLCTLWKITLQGGGVHTFTDLDRDVVFGGLTYESASGYSATAVESSSELNPDNLELEGFLQSPSITDADLHSGKWDYAYVEISEVNYEDLTMGRNILRSGTIGEVRSGRTKFTAELRGLTQAYSRVIVRLTTQDCTANLGDSRCKVSLAPWTVTGTVGSSALNRTINDAARIEAANWFVGGLLTMTSGLNVGRSCEVKRSSAGQLELHESMPFTVEVGDTYSVYAGCSKRFTEDCKGKFANGVNFRGFPHLPGPDIYAVGGVG